MLRSVSIALVAVLLGVGCRPSADVDSVGSPSGSVAGTEAPMPSRARSSTGVTGSGQRLPAALVAVAATKPGEAEPCEQVCGSLGDCLVASEAYSSTVALGLELECLDHCVHSPDESAAKTEFLACGAEASAGSLHAEASAGGSSDCGSLEACASRSWAALAGASQSPMPDVVAVAADPCNSGCRWVYACVYTNSPPGDSRALLDPELELQMNVCIAECQAQDPEQRAVWGRMAECMPSHCSAEASGECWGSVW